MNQQVKTNRITFNKAFNFHAEAHKKLKWQNMNLFVISMRNDWGEETLTICANTNLIGINVYLPQT